MRHGHPGLAGGGTDAGDRANRAYCQKSSVCHQETSSSKSGSVPPWTAAAASTAYWNFLLSRPRKAYSGRNRSRSPSHAVALDRNELGALLVAAGLGSPLEHALISLLALNGLRVSEATGADIEHLGLERGHRTLTITRKGGKIVTIPLAPRTARATGLAIGERAEGPVFLAADARRLDRHAAGRIVRRTDRRAGIAKLVTPHALRHAFITAAQVSGVASAASSVAADTRMMQQAQPKSAATRADAATVRSSSWPIRRVGTMLSTSLDAGVPLRDVREAASHADPRTAMRDDRTRASLDRHATYIVAAFLAGAAR